MAKFDKIPKFLQSPWTVIAGKIVLTAAALFVSFWGGFLAFLFITSAGVHPAIAYLSMLILPALLLPLIWARKRMRVLAGWGIFAGIFVIALGSNLIHNAYVKSITVNTSPNIDVWAYLPFEENSKIVRLETESTLRFTESDNLPVLDGAAAVFPVYSAFVNAVYPDCKETELYEGVFQYNNTVGGYRQLAKRETDIFFGAYPSAEQIAYAEEQGTHFVYTPIGADAFVFFVHKDNPIESLTAEQIRKIYSGEITNWREVGGKNEKIAAFQRNQGSGSQSMLIRFMGDTPLMDPPTELVNDLMSGIVEKVSQYRSTTAAIGFSYRYYMEGIIQNPDIKLIAIDGIAPTAENIADGTYPITTPLYAVTYKEQKNPNVQKLLDWICSAEGQKIIIRTGYAGIYPSEYTPCRTVLPD